MCVACAASGRVGRPCGALAREAAGIRAPGTAHTNAPTHCIHSAASPSHPATLLPPFPAPTGPHRQVISAPGKAAVTGVQVVSVARQWLPSSGRGGGGGGGSGGAVVADANGGAGAGSSGGRAGPKRPQPLAALAKHPGATARCAWRAAAYLGGVCGGGTACVGSCACQL